MNFARGEEGQPTLLSLDDARTLFHEFGHGLHGLLSDVTYPSISGTTVTRDFVELPSQLYEHWLMVPEVLEKFALHSRDRQADAGQAAEAHQEGAQLQPGLLDHRVSGLGVRRHGAARAGSGGRARRRRLRARRCHRLGMPREIVMRHRIPHFLHIMGGYAAGYYSYLWSEVMDADAFAAFEEAGDIFDRKTAKRLKKYIYSARQPARSAGGLRRLPRPAAEDREPAQEARVWGVRSR